MLKMDVDKVVFPMEKFYFCLYHNLHLMYGQRLSKIFFPSHCTLDDLNFILVSFHLCHNINKMNKSVICRRIFFL